jgi:hypothetical protein
MRLIENEYLSARRRNPRCHAMPRSFIVALPEEVDYKTELQGIPIHFTGVGKVNAALGVLTLLRRAGLPYTGAELAVAEVAAALAAQGLRPHTGHPGDHPQEVAR